MSRTPLSLLLEREDEVFARDGYAIARRVISSLRQKRKFEEMQGLSYGEVETGAFASYLEKEFGDSETRRNLFVDFGSGTGKAVLAACCFFERAVGVEIVKELHESAERSRDVFQDVLLLNEAEMSKTTSRRRVNPAFINADCFSPSVEHLWREADFLFIPATLFTDEMFAKVETNLRHRTKEGATVVVTTRKLSPETIRLGRFREMHSTRVKLRKGNLLFIAYEKQKKCTSS